MSALSTRPAFTGKRRIVWQAIVDAAHYPDYEVCLTRVARPYFDTRDTYDYFLRILKRQGLLTDFYQQHHGGRVGSQTYARVPMAVLETRIDVPSSIFTLKARDAINFRYWEWLDRESHPALWDTVRDFYQRAASPKRVCNLIAQNRPRNRHNSSLAASFWQENRALLLYALLTRPGAISELATNYLGLQGETMLYRYVTQQWGLKYRCCDPPQLHRQFIDGVGYVEGRMTWDSKHDAYRLESHGHRSYLLKWSPNRDFYTLDYLQGDVTLDHLAALEPHIPQAQLLTDIIAFCDDAGLPPPERTKGGSWRVDERVALQVYQRPPETLLAARNPCNCQWFDDATGKCGIHPKLKPHEIKPCEDWAELEFE